MAGFLKPPSASTAKGSSSKPSAIPVIMSVTKASLAGLKSKIRAVLPFMSDEMARYHLLDLSERITQALDVMGD